MRFAYIDSQGNEISIPSVDALELRIELGAIGPDTELYDGQADRWGPAHTHEIYQTLSRKADGEGFVAPPPLVPEEPAEPEPLPHPPPASRGTAPSPPPPKEPFFDLAEAIQADGDLGDWGMTEGHEGHPSEAAEPADADLDLEFTLVDEGDGEPPVAGPPVEPLKLDDPGEWEVPSEEPLILTDPDEVDDFELDVPFDAMDFSNLPPPSDPLALEGDTPPAWLEHEGSWTEHAGDAMDFTRIHGDAQASETPRADARRRERPEPRSRPSPPRRIRGSRGPSRTLLALLVVAVGAGGYYLWQTGGLEGWLGASPEEVAPVAAATMPSVPEHLLPTLRALGDVALEGTVEELRAMRREFELPSEPRRDWLAGVYLANASRFEDVQAYWESVGAYVDRVREVDAQVFHDRFEAQLAAAGIVGDTATMLSERADAGFLATRPRRDAAYTLMDGLVEASLDLHRFLLENESDISHEPAAGGVSRDPVLEAAPATRELGNRMWQMVDRITDALDALGTLDRVTTERLVGALLDRVQRSGFE